MNKYEILVNIVDQIRNEAPRAYKSYYPLETDLDNLNQARAKAFIHLFLKVNFGLLDFDQREKFVTDGTYDGGVDAYYIDDESRIIYLIQSKFRTNEKNFHGKDIDVKEILKMDIERIMDGEEFDEEGNKYNGKIQGLIKQLQGISDIGRYGYEVIILANLKKLRRSQIQKLVPNFPCTVFNFERCYQELVFPVINGTYYNPENLFININLANREYTSSRINYPVETEYTGCEITLLFVPTIEIAKVLYKYKNSILKYNPRSYLTLSNNSVNKEIARTVSDKKTNEFALFNNGITMLSDETNLQENVGRKNRGQLYAKNPQIINGGQTAYTLSSIYETALENGEDPEIIFGLKEVLLKVITFSDVGNNEAVLELIEEISKATNQQTEVKESDRRSNDKIQVELQDKLFSEFGYFYERKRGEFFDGLKNRYIEKTKTIDRVGFLRACNAMKGFPHQARLGENQLFKQDRFDLILDNAENAPKMLFAYLCYKRLEALRKRFSRSFNNKFGVLNYGNALRWGQYALTYVSCSLVQEEIKPENITSLVEMYTENVLKHWLNFEEFAKSQKYNRRYFIRIQDPDTQTEVIETNFDGYYKGATVKRDLDQFFLSD